MCESGGGPFGSSVASLAKRSSAESRLIAACPALSSPGKASSIPANRPTPEALARTLNDSEQFLEVAEVPRPAGGTLVANESVTADERDIDGPVPTTDHAATGVFEGDTVDPVE